MDEGGVPESRGNSAWELTREAEVTIDHRDSEKYGGVGRGE